MSTAELAKRMVVGGTIGSGGTRRVIASGRVGRDTVRVSGPAFMSVSSVCPCSANVSGVDSRLALGSSGDEDGGLKKCDAWFCWYCDSKCNGERTIGSVKGRDKIGSPLVPPRVDDSGSDALTLTVSFDGGATG